MSQAMSGRETAMFLNKADEADIDAVGVLYDAVCDHLETGVNGPHWKKGVYPTRADAEAALKAGELYVCRAGEQIAGTVRLSHIPENGYTGVRWSTPDDYGRITVLYALAVHPDYMNKGVGTFIMQEAERIAREEGCMALRLDAVKDNLPAERLYVRCGFHYVATKSLGYEQYGIPFYDLYEKIL